MNILSHTEVRQNGFTLIELMITISIVSILSAVAVPSYQDYATRARYTEVVSAAMPYKVGVGDCIMVTSDMSSCDAGANGVPLARTVATGQVASVGVVNGVITVTPVASNGIVASDTHVLVPNFGSGALTCSNSDATTPSGCVSSGRCRAVNPTAVADVDADPDLEAGPPMMGP